MLARLSNQTWFVAHHGSTPFIVNGGTCSSEQPSSDVPSMYCISNMAASVSFRMPSPSKKSKSIFILISSSRVVCWWIAATAVPSLSTTSMSSALKSWPTKKSRMSNPSPSPSPKSSEKSISRQSGIPSSFSSSSAHGPRIYAMNIPTIWVSVHPSSCSSIDMRSPWTAIRHASSVASSSHSSDSESLVAVKL